MEALEPNSIDRIVHRTGITMDSPSGKQQQEANIESFRQAALNAGVPESKIFSVRDLHADVVDNPQVRECLLALRSVFAGKVPRNLRKRRKGNRNSSFETVENAGGKCGRQSSSSEGTQQTPQGATASKTLTKDMRSMCNQGMRHAREQYHDPPNDVLDPDDGSVKFDKIVRPMLEHVVSKVQHEYETRLLKKENELATTREELLAMSRERRQAQQENAETKEDFEKLRTRLSQRGEQRRASQSHVEDESAEMAPAAFADPETLSSVLDGLRSHSENVKQLRQSLRATHAEARRQIEAQRESQKHLRQKLEKITCASEATLRKASKYDEMARENRKLFNEVQDLRGNIRVFCRIRPLLDSEKNLLTSSSEPVATSPVHGEPDALSVDQVEGEGRKRQKTFKYNRVFGPTSEQAEVYDELQPLIRSVCDGYSACIFAYGQTGSGKTHTMTGAGDGDERGLIWRALQDLFAYKRHRSNEVQYDLSIQMLEIYNEQIRDLLCSTNEDGRVEVKLGKGQSTVDGLETRSVECEEDIFQCMQLGFTNRFTATTKMNDVSSRSHSITLINVRGEGKSSDVGSLRTNGSLYLVDLAGSERVDKSEASGERLKEAQHINKSLSALGDVMSSLQAGEKHVPFRNSKLTSILKGPLCNRGKAMMFAHVNPHTSALQETLSTLQFADRVSSVELGKAANNAESKQVGELNEKVTRLEREISNLKSENSRLQRQPSASAQPESSSNATSQGQLHSHQQPQLYRKLKRPPTVNRTMQRSSTTQARPTSVPSQSDDRSVEQNHNSGQAGAHEGQSRPSSSSSTADASENKENEDSLSNADTDSLGVTASAEPAGAVPRRSNSKIPRPPLRKGAGSGEKQ